MVESGQNTDTVDFMDQKQGFFVAVVVKAKVVAERTQHQHAVVLPVAHDAVAAAPAEVPRDETVVHVEVEDLVEMEGKEVPWCGSPW